MELSRGACADRKILPGFRQPLLRLARLWFQQMGQRLPRPQPGGSYPPGIAQERDATRAKPL
jgi:hypothetical protein